MVLSHINKIRHMGPHTGLRVLDDAVQMKKLIEMMKYLNREYGKKFNRKRNRINCILF